MLETFNKIQLKEGLPDIRPGDTVKVYQKLKEVSKKTKSSKKEEGGEQAKEGGAKQGRIQAFEGLVIAKKHGKGINSTITVRRVFSGIGVERIFPLHSPNIEKIELISRGKARRAKLYYLREAKGKKGRLKRKEFFGEKAEEPKTEEAKSEVASTEEPAKQQEPAEKENK